MKTKLRLVDARFLAERTKKYLAPVCERIEIVGEVSRGEAQVSAIEMIAIPKIRTDLPPQLSIFDDEPQFISALDLLLETLVRADAFSRGDKNGPEFKNFLIEFDDDGAQVPLDLYLTTPDRWDVVWSSH